MPARRARLRSGDRRDPRLLRGARRSTRTSARAGGSGRRRRRRRWAPGTASSRLCERLGVEAVPAPLPRRDRAPHGLGRPPRGRVRALGRDGAAGARSPADCGASRSSRASGSTSTRACGPSRARAAGRRADRGTADRREARHRDERLGGRHPRARARARGDHERHGRDGAGAGAPPRDRLDRRRVHHRLADDGRLLPRDARRPRGVRQGRLGHRASAGASARDFDRNAGAPGPSRRTSGAPTRARRRAGHARLVRADRPDPQQPPAARPSRRARRTSSTASAGAATASGRASSAGGSSRASCSAATTSGPLPSSTARGPVSARADPLPRRPRRARGGRAQGARGGGSRAERRGARRGRPRTGGHHPEGRGDHGRDRSRLAVDFAHPVCRGDEDTRRHEERSDAGVRSALGGRAAREPRQVVWDAIAVHAGGGTGRSTYEPRLGGAERGLTAAAGRSPPGSRRGASRRGPSGDEDGFNELDYRLEPLRRGHATCASHTGVLDGRLRRLQDDACRAAHGVLLPLARRVRRALRRARRGATSAPTAPPVGAPGAFAALRDALGAGDGASPATTVTPDARRAWSRSTASSTTPRARSSACARTTRSTASTAATPGAGRSASDTTTSRRGRRGGAGEAWRAGWMRVTAETRRRLMPHYAVLIFERENCRPASRRCRPSSWPHAPAGPRSRGRRPHRGRPWRSRRPRPRPSIRDDVVTDGPFIETKEALGRRVRHRGARPRSRARHRALTPVSTAASRCAR